MTILLEAYRYVGGEVIRLSRRGIVSDPVEPAPGAAQIVAVTASADDGNVPARAIDGDLSTRWSADGDGQWITCELSSLFTVGAVNLAWFKGDERVAYFDVQLSTDGSSWWTAYRGSSSGTTLDFGRYDFVGKSASHARIIGRGNSKNTYNSLTEIQVLGVFDPPVTDVPPAPILTPVEQDGAVGLTWELGYGVGADTWTVRRATTSGGPYTDIVSGLTVLNYTDTNVVNGTKYFYRVRGVNVNGTGPDSAEKSATPVADTESAADKVMQVDFDGTPLGEYTEVRAQADWDNKLTSYRTNGNGHIVSNAEGGRMLQAKTDAGTIGNTINFKVVLPTHYDEGVLTYRLRFGDGFDFSKNGGKLPGLAGGPDGYAPKSCEDVDGTNGFSTRHMWHKGGTLENYVYHTDKPSKCGHNFNIYNGLVHNRWYVIRQRVVMNTPGQYNGILESWVDGVKLFSKTNFRWRASGVTGLGVNQIMFHTYFGGNVLKNWAHDRDEYIFYDDIVWELYN